MATVWTTMEKNAEGRFAETGYFTTEPEKWFRCFKVDDPEEFISHMHRFNSIPKTPLSREDYEKLCREFGVTVGTEEEVRYIGATTPGRKNSSLHTDPEQRDLLIAEKIHILRYKGILKSPTL